MGELVLPQYYEWHRELENVCLDTGVSINPDEGEELFSLANEFFELYPLKPEKLSAYTHKEKLAAAVVAYLLALRNSHDRETRFFGEAAINVLLFDFISRHSRKLNKTNT